MRISSRSGMLAACLVLAICTTAQAMVTYDSAVDRFCSIEGHTDGQPCSNEDAPSSCETADSWWNNTDMCGIPGATVPGSPANIRQSDVCRSFVASFPINH
eukprot:gene24237-9836_t